MFIYPSVHPTVYRSIRPPDPLSVSLSIHMCLLNHPNYLLVSPFTHLSVCLSVCPSTRPHLSVPLCISPSVHPFVQVGLTRDRWTSEDEPRPDVRRFVCLSSRSCDHSDQSRTLSKKISGNLSAVLRCRVQWFGMKCMLVTVTNGSVHHDCWTTIARGGSRIFERGGGPS